MNTSVKFKSIPLIFFKEMMGLKSNTLRKIDQEDLRFKLLRSGCKYIVIQHSENADIFFVREITDYTEWDGYAIISWEHIEKKEQ